MVGMMRTSQFWVGDGQGHEHHGVHQDQVARRQRQPAAQPPQGGVQEENEEEEEEDRSRRRGVEAPPGTLHEQHSVDAAGPGDQGHCNADGKALVREWR